MKKIFEIEVDERNIYSVDVNIIVQKYGVNNMFFAYDGVYLGVAFVEGTENDEATYFLNFRPLNMLYVKELTKDNNKKIGNITENTLLKAIAIAQNPELIKEI